MLDVWNIGVGSTNGSQVNLSIALADGTYNLQYLVGKNNDRGNDLFDISNGAVGSGSEVMLGGLLNRLGALTADDNRALSRFFQPEIRNSQDKVTGEVRPSDAWRE